MTARDRARDEASLEFLYDVGRIDGFHSCLDPRMGQAAQKQARDDPCLPKMPLPRRTQNVRDHRPHPPFVHFERFEVGRPACSQGQIGAWIRKAHEAAQNGATVVMLIPARVDTAAWHDVIFPHAEVRFVRGRLKFGAATENVPFPCAVVVFRAVA